MASPSQIRAGRHLAGISQAMIAADTGLSVPTIKRVESDRVVSVSRETLAAVMQALQTRGVIFVEENGEGPGVRLRKQRVPKIEQPVDASQGPERDVDQLGTDEPADGPEPTGPATDAFKQMDAAVAEHRGRKKR